MASPALPPRKRLEYKVSGNEFNIQELVNKLEDEIAFTVVVTKGYANNNIPFSGLEKDKAYRVQCVSRKDRVLACIYRHDGQPTFYSIPDTYNVDFIKVDKHRKEIGSKAAIYQLLHDNDNKLPMQVKFKTQSFIKVDGRALFTSHIPPMTLIQRFEEIHILLNHIPNIAKYDKIDDDIIYVPQFYDSIRFKRVTGFKDEPASYFAKVEKEINRSSSCLEFDMIYGNLDIAQFWPHQYRKELNYSNMEPMRCGIIPDLFPKEQPDLPSLLYEPLSMDRNADEGDVYCKIDDSKLFRQKQDYTNDIPRGVAKPMQARGTNILPSTKVTVPSSLKLERTHSECVNTKPLPKVDTPGDIKKLSIDEVCQYMELLKLGHHKPKFKDHLIDGVVLFDMDKAMLMKEFKFSAFDAIKLMHFIKEGHVPR